MTVQKRDILNFLKYGYVKIGFREQIGIASLRAELVHEIENYLNIQGCTSKITSLDQLHQVFKGSSINELRMHLINWINNRKNVNTVLIDESVLSLANEILGKDLLIQKRVNLVLQRPNDEDNSETHRDFPANSAFEIVVWIPLVDCDEKMSIYLADKELSLVYTKRLRQSKGSDWSEVRSEIERNATTVPVRYGEVLIFMTPLFHGSRINESESTRVSLNLRMKGLFSPSGLKDSYDFWDIYRLSPFSKSCLDFI